MGGKGTFSSSFMNARGWTGAGGRRGLKLGKTWINSKRRRTRRAVLQSSECRLRNCVLFSAILLTIGLGIHFGRVFFAPTAPEDGGGSKSPSKWQSTDGESKSSIVWQSTDGGSKSSSAWQSTSGGIGEATTDITTKGLYDEIAFKNEEGGVWRQGWNVQYKGSEWDSEELKVVVVPHSHNDPGRLRTVEEYYEERTRNILSTIVEALKKDKRRKFIWEEMSFLERWWLDATKVEKNEFKHLVKTGQLEIVGGGWVMNDEANSHYYAIIQQMIAGNLWLLDTIGVTPKNAWAIDPFGHSPTMAYLLKRMGFKNMLIQRTHYEVKKALARKKNLEFMWRQSWDNANTTDIFCHMMPFFAYDIPHTCGPDPSICCQFDFWRLQGVHGAEKCPWGKHPQKITHENVKGRAAILLDQYRKKSTLYRSNTLLVPLGGDFRYYTTQEAELQFTNLQKIFDYINSQAYLRATVNFGTLEDYFSTLRAEVGKLSSVEANSDSVPGFPTLSGDFFTYSDVRQDYWSGYYVSYPFYKAVDRILGDTLRGADILFSLTSAYCRAENSEFPLSSTSKLVSARRNLGLFQHHDGVTGTATNHVMEDYGSRMHSSLLDLQDFMAKSVRALLSKRTSSGKCANHNQEGNEFYEPEQKRANYNMLPVKTVVKVTGDQVRRVVLYNSLEEVLDQVVTVLVDEPLMCVFDFEWQSVPSQISPEWDLESTNRPETGKHRLQWVAMVPPMGLQAYIVAPSASSESCIIATTAKLSVFNSPSGFVCPTHYECSIQTDKHLVIENQQQILLFEGHTGLLKGVQIKDGGETVVVEEELAFYASEASGAYVFEPNGEAKSFVEPGGLILVSKGPLMEEVYSRPKCELAKNLLPVVRSARLYAGSSVQAGIAEIEYYTQLDQSSFTNLELIARFKTELNNKRIFFSDLNGFQTIWRETLDKIPLQGNYYPMPSLAFIQCPGGRRFSIHSRQALGVASLDKGWLEVMLDRRLLHDDGRGLGQGVLENHQNSVVFHLLLEKNISQPPKLEHNSSRLPSLLSHRAGAQLNHPLHAFLGRPEERVNIEASSKGNDPPHKLFSPFSRNLPCDLHVVAMLALNAVGTTASSKQSVGLLIQRRGFDASYGVSKNLARTEDCFATDDPIFALTDIFKDLEVSNTTLTSLNFVLDGESESDDVLEQLHRKERGSNKRERAPALIDMGPMEIKGYKFQLRSRAQIP